MATTSMGALRRVLPPRAQFARARGFRRRRASIPPRSSRAPVDAVALFRADADDFELLRSLGQVSYAVEGSAERTLTWTGGEDGSVPDSFSVTGSGGVAAGDAVMKLYAGKVIGWDDGGERSNAVPDVLLKEYVNAAAAPMADAEVEAYMALYGDPRDSTIGQRWDGVPVGEPFDPASLPVVPLVAFFSSRPVGGAPDGPGSLWTVQAWGPGGLTRLTDYPSRRQEPSEAKWWPPVQRVRDTGLGPRHRFARNAIRGVFDAVAAIHRRGVAHNAIDATSFQLNTTDDREADDVEVRLMNFGFAAPLTEETRRGDVRAAAVVAAEVVFGAFALGGPDHRTSAASLASLFDRVFALDPKRAREYCVEEPDWASAVEFWDYRDRQGDGWAILTDAWRGDASAEDILARLEAIETPYD